MLICSYNLCFLPLFPSRYLFVLCAFQCQPSHWGAIETSLPAHDLPRCHGQVSRYSIQLFHDSHNPYNCFMIHTTHTTVSWSTQPMHHTSFKLFLHPRYGCDKPDLRYGLEFHDVSKAVQGCSLKVLSAALDDGGVVKAIRVPEGQRISNSRLKPPKASDLLAACFFSARKKKAFKRLFKRPFKRPFKRLSKTFKPSRSSDRCTRAACAISHAHLICFPLACVPFHFLVLHTYLSNYSH